MTANESTASTPKIPATQRENVAVVATMALADLLGDGPPSELMLAREKAKRAKARRQARRRERWETRFEFADETDHSHVFRRIAIEGGI